MLEKKRSETRLKIISYVEISQHLFVKQLCSHRTSWVVSQATNIDILTWRQYRGEPKDRNIETEQTIYRHTETADIIRKDQVEIRLIWM